MMETRYINVKRHRRPDKHRYEPPFWRWLAEWVFVLLAAVLVIAAAEALCCALGCPTDPWALR